MPTLHWIGKDKVVNHHLEVPYRILQKQYTFGDAEKSENKIIHGDNLDALKSLLPEYEGKVKCIYIDPPYNTGNEGWAYNDNMSDPKLKKWLNKVVGREGEDLTRHDKWLCMMYPRLKLLNKLLTDDGVIFVSIDDNEQANLKLIMEEIFGAKNYLTSFVWKRRSGSNDAKNFLTVDHEYIVCYQKSDSLKFRGFEKDLGKYKNPNKDPRGPWAPDNLTCNKTKEERPNLYYDITDPQTGITYSANPNRVWAYERERMQRIINEDKVIFPKKEGGTPQYKRHASELRNLYQPVSSWIEQSDSGISSTINSMATKEVREIFGEHVFDYPKPINLVESIIYQVTNPGDLILDSFAGSGTTAHAVLNLNAQYPEEAKRKFILIETEEYAGTITAERVKRVINGYGKTEGTRGDFEYLTLGNPLMTEDGLLSSDASLYDIRSYICFTETGSHILDTPLVDHPYWLARSEDRDHYFYFERDNITVLDREFLSTIVESLPYYTIWADQCHLSASFMKKEGITFRKIPRDIRNI